jgi:hypothetical protein
MNPGETTPAAVVVESAPLWVVSDMVQSGQYEVVIVLSEDEEVLGLLRRDAVLRLAPRLPQAPVRMLPLQRALEIEPGTSLSEARALFEMDGEIEALLVEKPMMQGWGVVLRESFETTRRSVA